MDGDSDELPDGWKISDSEEGGSDMMNESSDASNLIVPIATNISHMVRILQQNIVIKVNNLISKVS